MGKAVLLAVRWAAAAAWSLVPLNIERRYFAEKKDTSFRLRNAA